MGNKKIIEVIDEKKMKNEVEVLACFNLHENNKTYAVYTKNEIDDNGNVTIYAYEYQKNKNEFVATIDDSEWETIKTLIRNMSKASDDGAKLTEVLSKLTLVNITEMAYLNGKGRVARVSNRIVSGLGNFYVNNVLANNSVISEAEVSQNVSEETMPEESISQEEEKQEEMAEPANETTYFEPTESPAEEITTVDTTVPSFESLKPEEVKNISDLGVPNNNLVYNQADDKLNPGLEETESVNPKDILNFSQEQKISEDVNFDGVFDNLASDISGANQFINKMISNKDNLDKLSKKLKEETEELDKKQKDFEEYVETERKALEREKTLASQMIETSKKELASDEAQFNSQMEAIKAEIALKEEGLKVEAAQLRKEREQLKIQQQLDEETARQEKLKLELEKEQLNKERALADEKNKNALNDLESQKSQFNDYKELEMKKIELEKKNLAQSCARFKELVKQFNVGVGQFPIDE